ncbi:hypothetical protein KIL84_009417 [Mauremys mutica]|uniref:Fish-egg lectin-like n=1 Tax=Mauremys mutica TaxID=74926 RepID=A0A9D3XIW0_9SAUR|nr:hypothetical protein KIL84_009417 [Mauremys mutica]
MLLWEFLLLLPLLAGSSAQDCIEIPGSLKQIDASNGQVFGVNSAGNIYTLYGDSWAQVPGSLKHVTVGPAGVWGVNNNDNIYKLVGGSWQQVTGLLKQIDAGGDMFVAGVSMYDGIYCLSRPATVSANSDSALPWVNIAGSLKYYSCGLWGCWGVNSADNIYFRFDVTPDSCAGSRDGITKSNPVGTTWTQVASFICNCKHVSYDLGLLWLITDQDKIVKCRI